ASVGDFDESDRLNRTHDSCPQLQSRSAGVRWCPRTHRACCVRQSAVITEQLSVQLRAEPGEARGVRVLRKLGPLEWQPDQLTDVSCWQGRCRSQPPPRPRVLSALGREPLRRPAPKSTTRYGSVRPTPDRRLPGSRVTLRARTRGRAKGFFRPRTAGGRRTSARTAFDRVRFSSRRSSLDSLLFYCRIWPCPTVTARSVAVS